jgi:hypothetical protein
VNDEPEPRSSVVRDEDEIMVEYNIEYEDDEDEYETDGGSDTSVSL